MTTQGVHVTTYHNDNARTGRYAKETFLRPATTGDPGTVNKDVFGKVSSLKVNGDVYAQPLFLSGVPVDGKAADVLYVATQHDSVYAFDVGTGKQVWRTPFLDGPAVTTIPIADIGDCDNIMPEVGITGTPVIGVVNENDLTTGTLYVVAKTKEKLADGTFACVQRLHALDVVKGNERPGSPKLIASQVIGGNPIQTVTIDGSGTGSNDPQDDGKPGDNDGNNHVRFFALTQNQRPGLLLSKGVVYVTWASHCDITPYHGWMIGYDAKTLELVSVFNATPSGGRAGIWQSGAAPAADAAGNIFFSTGNGTFDTELNRPRRPKRGDYGDSIVKLAPDPTSTPTSPSINGWGVKVVNYFTPFDQTMLGVAPQDIDLGSGGVLLLDNDLAPAPLLVQAGKKAVIYLINRNNMGKFVPSGDTIVQRIPREPCDLSVVGDVFGMPALFKATLYIAGAPLRVKDNMPIGGNPLTPQPVKAFRIRGGRIDVTPASQTTVGVPWHTHAPSISADGEQAGILWIIECDEGGGPAILHAFDASDLSKELYNSEQAQVGGIPRDRAGVGLKFTVPTIAKGKVYVGTSGGVTVYGKLGNP